MPSFAKTLSANSKGARFHHFLSTLIDQNFYRDCSEKISVKQMAADAGTDAIKATRCLREIYEAIFELNEEQPTLFQQKGIAVQLILSNGDNCSSFHSSLAALPRAFERLNFYFVKAKVGTDRFWVRRVEHELTETGIALTLWLDGGQLNRYREYALDKALFHGQMGFMEVYRKSDDEVNGELKKLFAGQR